MRKVLYICHGHPELIAGGAEIFARGLFKAIRKRGGFEAYFLARAGPQKTRPHLGTPFQTIAGNSHELLYYTDQFDYFLQSQPNKQHVRIFFDELLRTLRPDVIHFHHTVHLGLEFIRQARNTFPGIPIVYTLHEYIPICNADGQMVRTKDLSLCEEASPRRCHECFPDIAGSEFKMRELFIKSHFGLVDVFLAPSHFLRQRYLDWGIPEEKIRVLDYGRARQPEAPARELRNGEARSRFGYFGQLNLYKGVLVLLQAMRILEDDARNIHLFLHGANLDMQTDEFKGTFRRLIAECEENVTVMPQYQAEEIPSLMEAVDWVVIPSIWWENSPLVIQEAFMHKRPVIRGNIGGMAEKVSNGVDGLHFRLNDPRDLASKMLSAANTLGLWEKLRDGIGSVYSIEEATRAHVALYTALLEKQPLPF